MTPDRSARTTSYAESGEPRRLDRVGRWLNLRKMRRVTGSTSGKVCADIGCGFDARFARELLRDAAGAVLVDVSVGPQARAMPNATVLEGHLPGVLAAVDDDSLDLVYSSNVLEHLWDDAGTVREFHRILAPGGRCVINVPSWLGKPILEFVTFRMRWGPAQEIEDHKRYYDPQDLWPILVGGGFQPSNIRCRRIKLGVNTLAICTKA
jgi:SAM-dependent methyltransferase